MSNIVRRSFLKGIPAAVAGMLGIGAAKAATAPADPPSTHAPGGTGDCRRVTWRMSWGKPLQNGYVAKMGCAVVMPDGTWEIPAFALQDIPWDQVVRFSATFN